ncbi:MAG TPA: peptidylprolyl isomerase [Xanthomonadales bacterium]|nr:peptidylprolyl isomerase [Xanthomonadales bacterium]
MSMRILVALALLAVGSFASAQNTRVLMDTDRGPLLVELDLVRAPNTSANFLRYVDAGRYNNTLLNRAVRNFIVQGGGFTETGAEITRFAAINSERNNGLLNIPGTIAMALTGNPPQVNSATSDFYFNTGTNTGLDPNFTVFGKVVFGLKTLATLNDNPVFPNSDQPIRIPLLRRAVRVPAGEFPILPLHTGTWYDPANSGRGFLIEVAQVTGAETTPLMVVTWYDFFEGKQIWMIGTAPFTWGASSVEVPMQISTGAQFGAAFSPSQITTNPNWGRLTIRFTGCSAGTFTYTSIYGNGSIPATSLTLPTNESCIGN